MKYPSTLCIALALFATIVTKAQNKINYYPDSIRIEIPEKHSLLVFQMRSIQNDAALITNFPSRFKELMEYVKKSTQSDFGASGPYEINFSITAEKSAEVMEWIHEGATKPLGEKTLLTISKPERPKTNVLIKENQIVELLPPGWRVSITSRLFQIHIYSEDFENLISLSNVDLTAATKEIANDPGMKSIGRKSIYSRFIVNQTSTEKKVMTYNHPTDNIFLTAIAGAGLIQDKFYPELSLKFGLTFKDHFLRQNIRTSLIYNNMFFAEKNEGKYKTFSNSFLSLSFERNFNPRNGSAHWSGFGAGLLVKKNGDYFTGNTAKLFITHEVGNRVNIVPEFYLTNDFKKFVFGMSVKYSF